MNKKQLKHQDRLETLLASSPLSCRVINSTIQTYLKRFGEDKYIEGYAFRYQQHQFLEWEKSLYF